MKINLSNCIVIAMQPSFAALTLLFSIFSLLHFTQSFWLHFSVFNFIIWYSAFNIVVSDHRKPQLGPSNGELIRLLALVSIHWLRNIRNYRCRIILHEINWRGKWKYKKKIARKQRENNNNCIRSDLIYLNCDKNKKGSEWTSYSLLWALIILVSSSIPIFYNPSRVKLVAEDSPLSQTQQSAYFLLHPSPPPLIRGQWKPVQLELNGILLN